jgi:hypothetical protein
MQFLTLTAAESRKQIKAGFASIEVIPHYKTVFNDQ